MNIDDPQALYRTLTELPDKAYITSAHSTGVTQYRVKFIDMQHVYAIRNGYDTPFVFSNDGDLLRAMGFAITTGD